MDNREGGGGLRSFEGWRTRIPRFILRSRCENEVQLLSPQIKSKSEATDPPVVEHFQTADIAATL